jgi:hypothetical protein
VLRAIPEEAKGAVAKVDQHANSITLRDAACKWSIVAILAVAPVGCIVSMHEPAICTIFSTVVSCGIKVGPADADADV